MPRCAVCAAPCYHGCWLVGRCPQLRGGGSVFTRAGFGTRAFGGLGGKLFSSAGVQFGSSPLTALFFVDSPVPDRAALGWTLKGKDHFWPPGRSARPAVQGLWPRGVQALFCAQVTCLLEPHLPLRRRLQTGIEGLCVREVVWGDSVGAICFRKKCRVLTRCFLESPTSCFK